MVNSLFGWSWADPVAALGIAAVAIKEGRDAWRVDTCCAVLVGFANPSAERSSAEPAGGCGCGDSC